jgi:hypothetical protein
MAIIIEGDWYSSITCFKCGMKFYVPHDLYKHYKGDIDGVFKGFCCPNGHRMIFTGKTKLEELQNQIAHKDRVNDGLSTSLSSLHKVCDRRQRVISAVQGHKTRLKKKIEKLESPKGSVK